MTPSMASIPHKQKKNYIQGSAFEYVAQESVALREIKGNSYNQALKINVEA